MADEKKLIEAINGLSDEIRELRGEKASITPERSSRMSTEDLSASIKGREKLIELIEAEAKAEKNRNKQIELANELEEEREELRKENLALERKELEQKFKNEKINKEQYLAGKRKIDQDEKSIKIEKQLRVEADQTIKTTIKETASFLGLTKAIEILNNPLKVLVESMGFLNKASVELAQSGILMFDKFSNSSNILGTFVGQTKTATGAVETLTRYGVGTKEMLQSFGALNESMAAFNDTSEDTQAYLAGNAAVMKNLGVGIQEQGKNWNFLIKSLRMTGVEAGMTTDKLAKAAIGAGITTKKMLQDFGSIGPQLAAQGKKAVDIFIELQKQAKSLGVEVSSLMGTFGSAMDTFEGVAQVTGKFNAVMGGDYLNAMELLNATESERVDIVKRQMDATGKNFDTMSKYEKIAVANALGVKDLNEAQQILGVSTAEMERKKRQEAATQEKLNQFQAQAVEIGIKLASVFQVLMGAVMPFVKAISYVADGLLWLNDKGRGIPGIIVVGSLLAMALSTLNAKLTATGVGFFRTKISILGMKDSLMAAGVAAKKWALETFTMKNVTESFNAAAIKAKWAAFSLKGVLGAPLPIGSWIGGILSLIPLVIMLWQAFHDFSVPHSPTVLWIMGIGIPLGLYAMGRAADINSISLSNLAKSAILIGGAVFLAAYGISKLVESFKGLNGDQIMGATTAIALLGITLVGLVQVFAGLATSGIAQLGVGMIIGLGFAFFEVGAAVAIAAFGMSLFVDSLTKLSKESNAVPTIIALAGGIVAVTAAIGLLGVSITSFAVLGLGVMVGVYLIKKAIESLGEAFAEFPSEKAISFKASTESLTNVLKAAKELKNEDIKPSIELMNTAKSYLEVSNTSKGDDPAVKLLNKIFDIIKTATRNTTGEASSKPTEIILRLENGSIVGKGNMLSGKTAASQK